MRSPSPPPSVDPTQLRRRPCLPAAATWPTRRRLPRARTPLTSRSPTMRSTRDTWAPNFGPPGSILLLLVATMTLFLYRDGGLIGGSVVGYLEKIGSWSRLVVIHADLGLGLGWLFTVLKFLMVPIWVVLDDQDASESFSFYLRWSCMRDGGWTVAVGLSLDAGANPGIKYRGGWSFL